MADEESSQSKSWDDGWDHKSSGDEECIEGEGEYTEGSDRVLGRRTGAPTTRRSRSTRG